MQKCKSLHFQCIRKRAAELLDQLFRETNVEALIERRQAESLSCHSIVTGIERRKNKLMSWITLKEKQKNPTAFYGTNMNFDFENKLK